MLISDGESSFAIFLYHNLAIIQQREDILAWFEDTREGRVGRPTVIVSDSLETVNIFRINGKGYLR